MTNPGLVKFELRPKSCGRCTANPIERLGADRDRGAGLVPDLPDPWDRQNGTYPNRWREPFLSYSTTGGANNGGTEAINGLIKLVRRVTKGFRNPENSASECSSSAAERTSNPHSSQKSRINEPRHDDRLRNRRLFER